MAVKILIKRKLPMDKAQAMIELSRQLRILATQQEGYISGETLRRIDNPEEFLVISSWQSFEAWQKWLNSSQRKELQSKIDILLGRENHFRSLPIRPWGVFLISKIKRKRIHREDILRALCKTRAGEKKRLAARGQRASQGRQAVQSAACPKK